MKYLAATSIFLISSFAGMAQKIAGKLKFEQGQTYLVNVDARISLAQQVMGQAIDFQVNGSADHSYKVTNATDDNTTLHHTMNRITFAFDGMGSKMNFDSDNPKDMEGQIGAPIKDILDKKYDVIIDPHGKVLLAQPEKIDMPVADMRAQLVVDMLRELLTVMQPPKKGEGSFFRVLPENEAAIGDSWSEKGMIDGGEFENTYTLAEINDSTILVNFTGNSSGVRRAAFAGSETITTMKHKTTGVITLDKATGIVKQKKLDTESAGHTQFMGNSLPVSSTTNTVITVKR